MKIQTYTLCLLLTCSFTLSLRAQEDATNPRRTDRVAYSLNIEEVHIYGRRPIQDIGVQQTKLDTTVLRENITLSMADVLTQNTTIFIKQYGRATLSTASFRGTSPSHTQVTWNGMKLNSPMLGMVDFSLIPSYFIDNAALLHGTSSILTTGGGLGGAVTLSTQPARQEGWGVQYIQGISSFRTFDEFLRFTYGNRHWQASTRIVYSSSENRYTYRNYNKKENIYDDEMNIIDTYYPTERNKSGDFHDPHLLQEIYYTTGKGDRLGLSAWYMQSRRGVPMLNVDYKDNAEYTNEQKENTFRGVLNWDRVRTDWKLAVKAGYTYTDLGYEYSRDLGSGSRVQMIDSHSYVHTLYGSAQSEHSLADQWMFTAGITAHQHVVNSRDMNVITQEGNTAVVGYDQARTELSFHASVKWQPTDRLGLSAVIREDRYGEQWTPVIPAFFTDYVISKRGHVMAKASVSRNFRFPTLNDLYFLPGGNPDLKKEKGFTYDAGVAFSLAGENRYSVKGEVTWFDSHIDDWIVWLPTFKGFWTPMNVKRVHAYGIEVKAASNLNLPREWQLAMDGNFSWTPSINHGDPVNWADESIGKQLVYIPEFSSAFTGKLSYKSWRFTYKWSYYSERYTTSSNETATRIGRIKPYFMSDVSLETLCSFQRMDLSVKGVVNNLFNEEYESVLSRPMPRMSYGIILDFRPKFRK
ncbi:MAG: TonB-dependent receptor [Bacteroides sp.]|nr:TonB-dependent receptor [Bacteroides sp.]